MTTDNSPPDLDSTSVSVPFSATSSTVSQKRRRLHSSESPPAPAQTAPDTAPTITEPQTTKTTPSSTTSASTFRNVSACNRCRLRKNRCDQRLPACLSCEKAGVKCVGYDPITKREIPRSYVHYLEARNAYLESLLTRNKIPFHPPEYFDLPIQPLNTSSTTPPGHSNNSKSPTTPSAVAAGESLVGIDGSRITHKRQKSAEDNGDCDNSAADTQGRLNKLVSDIGLVSVQGASDPRYLGSVSGISFARVVFAAVKSSTANPTTGTNNGNPAHTATSVEIEGNGFNGSKDRSEKEDTAMRDSFFGLATNKKRVRPAKWPSRQLANRLVSLYFHHANPQLPVLHKVEFENMLDQVYTILKAERLNRRRGNCETDGAPRRRASAKELYMINIVFAIGAGIFLEKDNGNCSSSSGSSDDEIEQRRKKARSKNSHMNVEDATGKGARTMSEQVSTAPRATKKAKFDSDGKDLIKAESPEQDENARAENDEDDEMDDYNGDDGKEEKQYAPEAYHAAALPHLEVFLSSESRGGLEELQAILLLAGFALLRPVPPGLWYIVGVAMRLAVDLGLHFEDSNQSSSEVPVNLENGDKEAERVRGLREWVRDLRRKLWWCTYSLDRLVSTCVGRPFGIQDEVVSTRFPSLLPDELITIHGFKIPQRLAPGGLSAPILPTYKLISHHYFRLRLLQSEILQVLQRQQSMPTSPQEPYPQYHPFHLRTPYMRNFSSLQEWHKDVTRRVKEWIDTAPKSKTETGVDFAYEFFELNYWQTVLMLYRPCLKVPALLSGELGGGRGMIDSGGKGVGIGQLRGGNDTGGIDMGGLISGSQEEEDRVCWMVAEAGSKVLKLYRRLHRVHQVNYTFLATHHLFMSGIAFLYAIWHSPVVRSRLSMDDIDWTILAATSVLGDLVEKCPPAQACKEAFERMSKATVSMCLAGNGGSVGGISIPNTLGNIGILSDPRMDRQIKKRKAVKGSFKMNTGSAMYLAPQRARVMKGLGENTGFPLESNSMVAQQEQKQLRQQQQIQQATPQEEQPWQRQQMQMQPQQAHAPRVKSPAIFDIGFENLFQSGGVQMSESSYRSTQQIPPARRPQPQPIGYSSLSEAGGCSMKITTAGPYQTPTQFFGPAKLSPTSPVRLSGRQEQRLSQSSQLHQKESTNDTDGDSWEQRMGRMNTQTPSMNDDVMIDPELQREDQDSTKVKLSPGSEELVYPSPSVVSDTSAGGYSNLNPSLFDVGMDFDWNVFGENDIEGTGGGGMGMGMGMGMGQVDIFDGFFFGAGGGVGG